MKPMFNGFEISTFANFLVFVDIFRGMVVSALLIGLFCGMSTVCLEKLPEEVYPDSIQKRVDYHRNRATFVACIIIGLTICVADILMAVAMDNILRKNLRKASLMWMSCSLLGIFLRIAFYAYLWKNQLELGFDRLHVLTPTVKFMARMLFVGAVAYETIKIVQLITGIAVQMELLQRGNEASQNKNQVAPKKVTVGMIGGSKRWID